MGTQTLAEFRWAAPLGLSVGMFLLISLAYFVIGLATPAAFRAHGERFALQFGLVLSARADAVVFGRPPAEIVRSPGARATQNAVWTMIAGLYLAVAVLHAATAWFGLRTGHGWALAALVLADVAVFGWYLLAARTFAGTATHVDIADLAPYVLLPAMMLPFAAVLGWLGLRQLG
jgi:uncharacterized membrane protein YccF (DUF307 family)